MPRRVFLHVGSPKTGTSFLHSVLWAHRELTREQGLLLPGRSVADHFRASVDVREDMRYVNDPDRVAGSWAALVEEAMNWHGDALISHELFAPATAEQAGAAVAALSAVGEVHVVVTARDLVRQLPAHWQENLKARSAETFAEFMGAVRADVAREKWFWLAQSYPDILARWGAGLPAERLHVVTVPPRGSAPCLLWERFAGLIGLDPTAFDLGRSRRNESLGLEQAELLRRLNACLGGRLARPGPYAGVVNGYFAHRVLADQGGTPFGLDGEDLSFACDESRTMALRLAGGRCECRRRSSRPGASGRRCPVTARQQPSEASVSKAQTDALINLLEQIPRQRERHNRELAALRRRLERARQGGEEPKGRHIPPKWMRRLGLRRRLGL